MQIEPASDSSVLVRFGESISTAFFHEVMGLFRALKALDDPRIRNFHPAYASLSIDFDPLRMSFREIESMMESAVRLARETPLETNLVRIPVCYDPEFGPDLDFIAEGCGIPPAEVVRLHSHAAYIVHFLGFSPGFGYLGGLPEQLEVPRLETPRKHVPAGSVGIAGKQTGIYPVDSPGGWRLIGRTPLRMFNPLRNPPTKLQPGDAVQFVAIDRANFDEVAKSESSR
ncbi:MAG: 5-oxoprolinase subunit PxpB [Acidobacteriaceae bacterium]